MKKAVSAAFVILSFVNKAVIYEKSNQILFLRTEEHDDDGICSPIVAIQYSKAIDIKLSVIKDAQCRQIRKYGGSLRACS